MRITAKLTILGVLLSDERGCYVTHLKFGLEICLVRHDRVLMSGLQPLDSEHMVNKMYFIVHDYIHPF